MTLNFCSEIYFSKFVKIFDLNLKIKEIDDIIILKELFPFNIIIKTSNIYYIYSLTHRKLDLFYNIFNHSKFSNKNSRVKLNENHVKFKIYDNFLSKICCIDNVFKNKTYDNIFNLKELSIGKINSVICSSTTFNSKYIVILYSSGVIKLIKNNHILCLTGKDTTYLLNKSRHSKLNNTFNYKHVLNIYANDNCSIVFFKCSNFNNYIWIKASYYFNNLILYGNYYNIDNLVYKYSTSNISLKKLINNAYKDSYNYSKYIYFYKNYNNIHKNKLNVINNDFEYPEFYDILNSSNLTIGNNYLNGEYFNYFHVYLFPISCVTSRLFIYDIIIYFNKINTNYIKNKTISMSKNTFTKNNYCDKNIIVKCKNKNKYIDIKYINCFKINYIIKYLEKTILNSKSKHEVDNIIKQLKYNIFKIKVSKNGKYICMIINNTDLYNNILSNKNFKESNIHNECIKNIVSNFNNKNLSEDDNISINTLINKDTYSNVEKDSMHDSPQIIVYFNQTETIKLTSLKKLLKKKNINKFNFYNITDFEFINNDQFVFIIFNSCYYISIDLNLNLVDLKIKVKNINNSENKKSDLKVSNIKEAYNFKNIEYLNELDGNNNFSIENIIKYNFSISIKIFGIKSNIILINNNKYIICLHIDYKNYIPEIIDKKETNIKNYILNYYYKNNSNINKDILILNELSFLLILNHYNNSNFINIKKYNSIVNNNYLKIVDNYFNSLIEFVLELASKNESLSEIDLNNIIHTIFTLIKAVYNINLFYEFDMNLFEIIINKCNSLFYFLISFKEFWLANLLLNNYEFYLLKFLNDKKLKYSCYISKNYINYLNNTKYTNNYVFSRIHYISKNIHKGIIYAESKTSNLTIINNNNFKKLLIIKKTSNSKILLNKNFNFENNLNNSLTSTSLLKSKKIKYNNSIYNLVNKNKQIINFLHIKNKNIIKTSSNCFSEKGVKLIPNTKLLIKKANAKNNKKKLLNITDLNNFQIYTYDLNFDNFYNRMTKNRILLLLNCLMESNNKHSSNINSLYFALAKYNLINLNFNIYNNIVPYKTFNSYYLKKYEFNENNYKYQFNESIFKIIKIFNKTLIYLVNDNVNMQNSNSKNCLNNLNSITYTSKTDLLSYILHNSDPNNNLAFDYFSEYYPLSEMNSFLECSYYYCNSFDEDLFSSLSSINHVGFIGKWLLFLKNGLYTYLFKDIKDYINKHNLAIYKYNNTISDYYKYKSIKNSRINKIHKILTNKSDKINKLPVDIDLNYMVYFNLHYFCLSFIIFLESILSIFITNIDLDSNKYSSNVLDNKKIYFNTFKNTSKNFNNSNILKMYNDNEYNSCYSYINSNTEEIEDKNNLNVKNTKKTNQFFKYKHPYKNNCNSYKIESINNSNSIRMSNNSIEPNNCNSSNPQNISLKNMGLTDKLLTPNYKNYRNNIVDVLLDSNLNFKYTSEFNKSNVLMYSILNSIKLKKFFDKNKSQSLSLNEKILIDNYFQNNNSISYNEGSNKINKKLKLKLCCNLLNNCTTNKTNKAKIIDITNIAFSIYEFYTIVDRKEGICSGGNLYNSNSVKNYLNNIFNINASQSSKDSIWIDSEDINFVLYSLINKYSKEFDFDSNSAFNFIENLRLFKYTNNKNVNSQDNILNMLSIFDNKILYNDNYEKTINENDYDDEIINNDHMDNIILITLSCNNYETSKIINKKIKSLKINKYYYSIEKFIENFCSKIDSFIFKFSIMYIYLAVKHDFIKLLSNSFLFEIHTLMSPVLSKIYIEYYIFIVSNLIKYIYYINLNNIEYSNSNNAFHKLERPYYINNHILNMLITNTIKMFKTYLLLNENCIQLNKNLQSNLNYNKDFTLLSDNYNKQNFLLHNKKNTFELLETMPFFIIPITINDALFLINNDICSILCNYYKSKKNKELNINFFDLISFKINEAYDLKCRLKITKRTNNKSNILINNSFTKELEYDSILIKLKNELEDNSYVVLDTLLDIGIFHNNNNNFYNKLDKLFIENDDSSKFTIDKENTINISMEMFKYLDSLKAGIESLGLLNLIYNKNDNNIFFKYNNLNYDVEIKNFLKNLNCNIIDKNTFIKFESILTFERNHTNIKNFIKDKYFNINKTSDFILCTIDIINLIIKGCLYNSNSNISFEKLRYNISYVEDHKNDKILDGKNFISKNLKLDILNLIYYLNELLINYRLNIIKNKIIHLTNKDKNYIIKFKNNFCFKNNLILYENLQILFTFIKLSILSRLIVLDNEFFNSNKLNDEFTYLKNFFIETIDYYYDIYNLDNNISDNNNKLIEDLIKEILLYIINLDICIILINSNNKNYIKENDKFIFILSLKCSYSNIIYSSSIIKFIKKLVSNEYSILFKLYFILSNNLNYKISKIIFLLYNDYYYLQIVNLYYIAIEYAMTLLNFKYNNRLVSIINKLNISNKTSLNNSNNTYSDNSNICDNSLINFNINFNNINNVLHHASYIYRTMSSWYEYNLGVSKNSYIFFHGSWQMIKDNIKHAYLSNNIPFFVDKSKKGIENLITKNFGKLLLDNKFYFSIINISKCFIFEIDLDSLLCNTLFINNFYKRYKCLINENQNTIDSKYYYKLFKNEILIEKQYKKLNRKLSAKNGNTNDSFCYNNDLNVILNINSIKNKENSINKKHHNLKNYFEVYKLNNKKDLKNSINNQTQINYNNSLIKFSSSKDNKDLAIINYQNLKKNKHSNCSLKYNILDKNINDKIINKNNEIKKDFNKMLTQLNSIETDFFST